MILKKSLPNEPAEPLWKRVPVQTDAGELVSDFIMILSGMKKLGELQQKQIFDKLYQVLKVYNRDILLAEVNTQLNTLWISHKPRPGLGTEIASLIHHHVPQAKLISQRFI